MSRPHMSLVALGHVDAGKSTTLGNLLYTCGAISEREMVRLTSQAEDMGKTSFKYAWIFDKTRSERERGISIENSVQKIETLKSSFTLVDAPGHRDFSKNAITAISQAHAALLVISAESEFEYAMGAQGQTREHALLAHALGIQHLIVAVNKMDCVKYSQERFDEIQQKTKQLLEKIGFNLETVSFVPICGWGGDNLLQNSQNLAWWQGPTLFEAMDALPLPDANQNDSPLRISVQNVYKIMGIGTVVAGRVETGVLRAGMNVTFAPANVNCTVKSIEMHHEQLDEAIPGYNIGFNVKDVSSSDIRRGYVCGDPSNNPPSKVDRFYAQVVIINHPGEILVGYSPVVDCHAAHIACKWTEFVHTLDRVTGEILEDRPQVLKTGDCALVIMQPLKPMTCESFSTFPTLGRFVVRDLGTTIGVGVIQKVEKKVREGRITKAAGVSVRRPH